MLHDRNADYILTYSGKKLSVLNPLPEQICIYDIAHGLSHKYRFGGQTLHSMTVAEHSVNVSKELKHCDAELCLAALLHDASEAYMSDIPTPYKILLPDYRDMERKLMAAIFDKFFEGHISWNHSQIKAADDLNFSKESGLLMTPSRFSPVMPSYAALSAFMKQFRLLSKILEG